MAEAGTTDQPSLHPVSAAATPAWKLGAGLLLFTWAAVVLAAYYIVHKPLSLALLVSLWPAVVVVASCGLAQVLGAWLLPSDAGLSERGRFGLSIGLGLGLLGVLQLALAAMHIFSIALAWGLIILTLVLGRRRLPAWRAAIAWPADRPSQWLAIFCGLALGSALLQALAPPIAWDALVYHLTAPKLDLAAHGVVHTIDLPYLGFPEWGEMLFLWVMQLGGDRAAAVMQWAFAPLTLLLLPDLLRPLAPKRAWLAAAILLSSSTAVLLAGWPYVEWPMMFAITAGALALARWQATGQRRWLLLAGILGGLAFAAKYTAAGAILGLATAVLLAKPGDSWEPVANVVGSRTETRSDQPRLPGWIRRWVHLSSKAKDVMLRPAEASPGTQRPFGRPQGDKSTPSLKCTSRRFRVLGPIILFVSGALLTILPWILKNYLLTGNPVYPFFLPGKFWDADRAWWYSRGGTGLPLERLLIAPWEMTVQGVEGASGYSATLGPLWLVLLPALLIAPAARRPLARQRLRLLLVITGVAYTVWLVQVGWSGMLVQSRLLLAIFPILACLAAAAFDHLAALSTEHLHTRWVIGAVVGLVLLFTGIETGRNLLQDNPLPVLGGSQSESDYLKYKLGWYTAVMEEINTLPEDSKVLFLWEPRSYYCRITCLPDALLDRWWHTRRMGATAVDIAAQWQALGVTHVLVYEFGRSMIEADGYDPLTPADWAEFTALRQHLTPLRDFDGVYQLYRFAAVNSHPDTGGPYTRYGNE